MQKERNNNTHWRQLSRSSHTLAVVLSISEIIITAPRSNCKNLFPGAGPDCAFSTKRYSAKGFDRVWDGFGGGRNRLLFLIFVEVGNGWRGPGMTEAGAGLLRRTGLLHPGRFLKNLDFFDF